MSIANFIARAVLQTRLAGHALRQPLILGTVAIGGIGMLVVLHAKIFFALACVWSIETRSNLSPRTEYVWPNLPTVGRRIARALSTISSFEAVDVWVHVLPATA